MLILAPRGAFVFVYYLEKHLVDSINNQNINQPGLNAANKSDNSAQDKDPKKETEKLQKELQDRIKSNKVRLQGNETNIKQLEKEIKECGVWAKVSGHKAALEKELKSDREFRENLFKQQAQLEKTQAEAQKLMSQGKVEEAQALLLGKEVQRKQDLETASSQYMSGLKDANKGYKDADKFLERTETGLKIARNTAVVVGATVATGGAAGAMMAAGYGTAAVAAGAIAAGTAAGTNIGALSNLAKATEEVAVYGRDANEAFKEAGSQTLQDAKSSAIASAGTVAGLGAAGKVVGQAASLTGKALSGMVAGGTNSVVSTTINVAESRVKAEQEFNSLYGEQTKNMTSEQIDQFKQQFLAQRGLTTDQIIKNAAVDVTVGMVSGSQGGASGAVKDATKSTLKKVAMTGLEASGSVAIGFTGAYAKEGEITFETVAQEVSNAVIGNIVGEVASKKPGSTNPELVRKLTSEGFTSLEKAQIYVERMERMNSLADEYWGFHSADKSKALQSNMRKEIRNAATSGILEINAAGWVENDGTPKRHLERTCAAFQRVAREEGYGISGDPAYDAKTKKMKITLQPGGAKKMSLELYRNVLKTIEPDITPSDLFPGGTKQLEFAQGGIGDCYLIAGLYSLAKKHPRGEQLLPKMIKIRPDGTLKVVFPGYPNEPINLTRAYVRELSGIDGPIGVKILERAYAELRRKTESSRGGMARKTALEAGFGHNALKALTGDEPKWLDSSGNKDVLAGETLYGITDTFANSNPTIIREAKNLLNQLSRQKDKFVTVANTPTVNFAPNKTKQKVRYGKEFREEEIGFMDKQNRFFAQHAYSVIDVNRDDQTVTVVNPHNTKLLRYVLSYDDFLKYFCSFSGSKINGS